MTQTAPGVGSVGVDEVAFTTVPASRPTGFITAWVEPIRCWCVVRLLDGVEGSSLAAFDLLDHLGYTDWWAAMRAAHQSSVAESRSAQPHLTSASVRDRSG
jgi:hypothetical protein